MTAATDAIFDTLATKGTPELLMELADMPPTMLRVADEILCARDKESPLNYQAYRFWKSLMHDHYSALAAADPNDSEGDDDDHDDVAGAGFAAKAKAITIEIALANLCMLNITEDVETGAAAIETLNRRTMKKVLVPASVIADSATCRQLARYDIEISADLNKAVRKRITEFLGDRNNVPKPTTTRCIWHTDPISEERRFFVPDKLTWFLPTPTGMADANSVMLFQMKAIAAAHEPWRKVVSAMAADPAECWAGLLLLGAAYATSFMPEMGEPLGRNAGATWHVHGRSGTGKSTLNNLIHRMWHPRSEPMQTWNTTVIGLTSALIEHNLVPFVLDELGSSRFDNDELANTLFGISEGVDRGRANQDGSRKAGAAFTTMVFSTGEGPIESPTGKDGEMKRLVNLFAPVVSLNVSNMISDLLADDSLIPIFSTLVYPIEDLRDRFRSTYAKYLTKAEQIGFSSRIRGLVETRARQFAVAHLGVELLLAEFECELPPDLFDVSNLFAEQINEMLPRSLADDGWASFCEWMNAHRDAWYGHVDGGWSFQEKGHTFKICRVNNGFGYNVPLVLISSSDFKNWLTMTYGDTLNQSNLLREWTELGRKLPGNKGQQYKWRGGYYIAIPESVLVAEGMFDVERTDTGTV